MLPSALVNWLRTQTSVDAKPRDDGSKDNVLKRLFELSRNGHADYSNFPVVSCIVSSEGRQYFGTNCENASFPQGLRAEAVAIGAMVTAGERDIAEVHLFAPKNDDVAPCGDACKRYKNLLSQTFR